MSNEPTATLAAAVTKPLLRGWLHLVCFFLAIPAAVLVVVLATSGRGRVGAIVYAVGLVALFGVSGTYHRGRWTDAKRRLMQQLDHGTIFVMIAGQLHAALPAGPAGLGGGRDARHRLVGRRGGLRAVVHRQPGHPHHARHPVHRPRVGVRHRDARSSSTT